MGTDVQHYSFCTSAVVEVSFQLHAVAALTREKCPAPKIDRKMCGSPKAYFHIMTIRRVSALARYRTPFVLPAAYSLLTERSQRQLLLPGRYVNCPFAGWRKHIQPHLPSKRGTKFDRITAMTVECETIAKNLLKRNRWSTTDVML
jgi:hypothetical protein